MNEIKLLKNLTILYIEDEDDILQKMKKTFSYFIDTIYTATNITDAKVLFEQKPIDIIITDINLHEESGIEFIKQVRQTDKKIPIIIITAFSNQEYLLEAIKLNLVSYLIKPITIDEIIDALKGAVEKMKENNTLHIRFQNGYKYNPKDKHLYNQTDIINLTHMEEKLLELLLHKTEEYLSKETIKYHLWENEDVSDNAFKSVMNKLRKKVGKESIINISKTGYRLLLH